MRNPPRNLMLSVIANLGWPLLLGLGAAVIFYLTIDQLDAPLLSRYFAGHWVEYVETALFFVGLATLAMIGASVMAQYLSLDRVRLDDPPQARGPAEESSRLLDMLAEAPAGLRQSYLGRRLIAGLEYVERNGSAEGLEEEIKYHADLDLARMSERYALVRIIIWATPMLGFLGTVIGITLALGNLSPSSLVDATKAQESTRALLDGLSVAFDTTALALALSMVLMFLQFLVERFETQLLGAVDARAEEQLLGRFHRDRASHDPQVAVVQSMSRQVLSAVEELTHRQNAAWEQAVAAWNQQTGTVWQAVGEQLRSGLGDSLDRTLDAHSQRLLQLERRAGEQMEERMAQWTGVLREQTESLVRQQQELSRQGETAARVLEATAEVIRLEDALNRNLDALAGAQNFEEAVASLTAAIHLLTSRVARQPEALPTGRKGNAA